MPIAVTRFQQDGLIRSVLCVLLIALAAQSSSPAPAEAAFEPPSRLAETVSATASADTTLGVGTLTDTASVAGWSPEAGAMMTFRLYGPDDTTCQDTPLLESIVPYIAGAGGAMSAAYTPNRAGTYRWRAQFSSPSTTTVTTACDDPSQDTFVDKATPVLSAVASPSVRLGAGTLRDIASVSGRVNPQPGSTVTFALHGPNDPTCSAPIYAPPGVPYPNSGSSTVTSPTLAPLQAGVYRWRASYSGDANNKPATTACSDGIQFTLVAKAAPVVASSPGAGSPGGVATLNDTATVVGRVSPVGGATIDFNMYGPDDPTCARGPAFVSTGVPYPEGEAAAVTSAPYAPPTPGSYRWIAFYSGDTNNAAAIGVCSAETTVVGQAPPPCATCDPRNSLAPAITGSPLLGRQLMCGAGVWTGIAPMTFAYAWKRDGAKVGAGAKYKVVTKDVKHKLVCEVTASNPAGTGIARSASVTATKPSAFVRIRTEGVISVPRPAGVSLRRACRGSVSLRLLRRTRTLGTRTVRLDATCHWAYTFKVRRTRLAGARTLRLQARFGGNRYGQPVSFVRTVQVPS